MNNLNQIILNANCQITEERNTQTISYISDIKYLTVDEGVKLDDTINNNCLFESIRLKRKD